MPTCVLYNALISIIHSLTSRSILFMFMVHYALHCSILHYQVINGVIIENKLAIRVYMLILTICKKYELLVHLSVYQW